MSLDRHRKILAGARLRKLRNELGVSQVVMAQDLEISASYLNLIERNLRPITAQLLIKLSEAYGADPKTFAGDDEARALQELEEVFADPMFKQDQIGRAEIKALAEAAPTIADAVKRLFRAHSDIRELNSGNFVHLSESERGGESVKRHDPYERMRSFLESSANYFDGLDRAAENLTDTLNVGNGMLFAEIIGRLKKVHGISTVIVPHADMQFVLRHHDRHRRKLMLSETLDAPGRVFQAAVLLANLEARDDISIVCENFKPEDGNQEKLARVTFANYFAAALVMPYGAFAEAAESLGYDIDLLCGRFSASFEQVAHRLTTLSRPGKPCVPFFMVRVDAAGNISKRFSSGAFPFSRVGGTCARWNIHHAFQRPGVIERQNVEMPDGSKWLTISRSVSANLQAWNSSGAQFVVSLGCALKYAPRLVYGRDIDVKNNVATPIGINCRLCERPNCAQRSAAPLMNTLSFSEHSKGVSAFPV
jgi:predicted transcriptional regulator/transcriptional regulator with XRE-family HTH domain